MAGKHQGNVFASLMTNFDTAREALDASLNSSGSAMREHAKWSESLEARLNSLKASWQGLSQAFLTSDFLKTALNAVINLVDGITFLINKVGSLPTLLGVVAGGLSVFKNKGLVTFDKETKSIQLFGTQFKKLGDEYSLVQTKIAKYNALSTESQEKIRQKWASSNTTFGKYISGLGGAKASFGGYIKSLVGSTVKTVALEAATMALNAAITMGISALISFATKVLDEIIVTSEELAEKVDEVTSKYKEQHKALKDMEGDLDTSKESSMISKYEKLSKGVDNLGRNVSLTADEYSEYQSIVNKISEQIPSLVSGYDEQGNAILSCKGNVDELTAAYEKLIHTQNQSILANAGDIEDDFANKVKDANGKNLWGSFRQFSTNTPAWLKGLLGINPLTSIANTVEGVADLTVGSKMTTDTAKILKDLLSANRDNASEIIADYDKQTMQEIQTALESAGINTGFMGKNTAKVLEETLKNDSTKIKGIVENFYGNLEATIINQKTIATAKLSEAFDVSSVISGLNYGNIGEDLQAIAYQVVNSFDYDFLSNLLESGKTVEQWTTEMLNQLNAISKADNVKIEAGFDLQTKFNGGEISYGEYVDNLSSLEDVIDNLNLKEEVKEQLKIALTLDENGIVDQYNSLIKRLTDTENYDFNISEKEAKKLLDGLSSEELSVVTSVVADASNNDYYETAEEIKTSIERELSKQGLSLDITVEKAKVNLEALSTAISESFSASGLSEESIDAVEGIFGSLSSYDPSKLFERTANGIRLNSEEFRRLNSETKKTNLSEINKQMDSLGDIYNQTREELYNLTYGTDEYNAKAAELSGIEQRINELEKLESGYRGVASAFQEWQMIESAGSQRDMYESIIDGLEGIDDEISRGWYDDGTIEFLELLTGKDLSTAGIDEVKRSVKELKQEIGNTGYTVRDFFTVNDDGDSTSTGVYNFLRAVDRSFAGKDIIQRENGNIVGFDFQVVGGDKAVAEALGVSEELVQIMKRAADDAGFVVTMDGTYQQLDVLKEKAQESAEALNRILESNGKNGFDFNFNSSDVDDITKQLSEAQKILNTFRNTDGTINTELKGADEALTVASTLQSMLDRLTRPAYMNIETNQVESELQEPLRQLQQLRTLTETEHQLKLSGGDTTEIKADINELYAELDALPDETKIEIGLVDENKQPLTGDALKKKIDNIVSGETELGIKATVDIQLEMDEKLGILVDKALLDAGIIDNEEFEKRVDIYLKADVNSEEVKDEIEKSIDNSVVPSFYENSVISLERAEKGIERLKSNIHASGLDIDFNLETNNIDEINKEIEKAVKVIDFFNEKYGVDFIDEGVWIVEYLQSKKDKLEEPIYMSIDTSELNSELQQPIKLLQDYERLIQERNLLNFIPDIHEKRTRLSEINGELNTIIETLKTLPEEVQVDLGIKGLSTEELAKKLEDGSIEIPTGVSVETQVEASAEKVDTSDIEKKTKESVKETEKKIEKDNESLTVETTVEHKTAIEEASEIVQSFEDKDITIDVKVEGLGDVKELNKNIDLATKIKGSVDNLSEYVEGAKALSELDDNIVSFVTANVKGNVTKTPEYKLNNLKVFADSVKELKDFGSFASNVESDIKGNVVETPEYKLNNLKVFADSVKDLKDIGSFSSEVVADIQGNVIDKAEYKINNLKVFADSIKDLASIGNVESNVTATINSGEDGDVIDEFEYKLNNLGLFATHVKELQGLNSVDLDINAKVSTGEKNDAIDTFEYRLNNLGIFATYAKELQGLNSKTIDINANVNTGKDGDAIDEFEYKLNNLGEFATHAKELQGLNSVDVNIVATVNTGDKGDAIDTFEHKLNNLDIFAKGAKALQGIGNISSEVTAKISSGEDGDVVDEFEYKLNNLELFANSAKILKDVGDVSTIVTAKVNTGEKGDAVEEFEYKLDNLETFAKGVKELQGLQSVDLSVTAKINTSNDGKDALNIFENKLDNLELFAQAVQKLQGLESVDISVKASISSGNDGDVIDEFEYKLNNLEEFSKYASALQGLEGVDITINANIDGNAIETAEYKINNLGEFEKHARALQDISSKDITIKANIDGNVPEKTEGYLNDLQVFAEGAKGLQDVSSKTVDITANIYGNVPKYSEDYLNDLDIFAKGANALQTADSKTVEITANAKGNVIEGDGSSDRLSSLTEFKSLVNGMSNQTVTFNIVANVDSANINSALTLLKDVANSGVFKDYKATVQVGAKIDAVDDTVVKNYNAPHKDGKVSYSVDLNSSVFNWTAPSKDGVVNYEAEVEALTDAQKHKTGTITYKANVVGIGGANGTANVDGTAGKSFKQGSWGTKDSGVALMGELGRETIVRDGKFFTVGDSGAGFYQYKKGDIIFNHKQTEELFKNGKVTSGNGRGKAFANGTAFAEGTDSNTVVVGTNKNTGKVYTKSVDSDSSKDFQEIFDLIEISIKRIEREIGNLDRKANNTYKSWSERSKNLTKQINAVGDEIALQQKAYEEYMAAANGTGLSSEWIKKIQNGEIDIESITDETLAEKVKDYQAWYDKALDCKDAIEELKEEEAKLFAQRFENIQTQYDSILQGYEHTESMLNEYINQSEAKGYIVSEKYYEALIDNEEKNIDALIQKRSDLIAERDKLVAEGKIEMYSEEWYNMSNDIDGVTQAIESGTTKILEYKKAIDDIDFEKFDLAQEYISDVVAESDFMIELMSNKDMYDDKGNLTAQGAATLGLHGLNYNTHMYQADEYGKEIADIDRRTKLDKNDKEYLDPNSKEVINRRRELIELQRESILAAEDEKQAIKDLVQDGIDKELDALQDLIDKKNESLESEKELYEYQKKVQEQTESIASLRKEMAAYENDNSEEAKAKIQELRVSLSEAETELKETEWDKYISDTSALLDTLYTDYETILNARLDNVDFLLQQVIDGINIASSVLGSEGAIASALGSEGAIASAIVSAVGENGSIKSILNTEATAVGTKLSTAMNSIWNVGEGNAKSVLTTYGEGFQTKQTTTNSTLNSIKISVDKMANKSDKDAQKKVETNKTQPSTKADPTKDNKKEEPKKEVPKKTSGDGKPKVGDKVKFVSGQYYYDSQGKKPLGYHNRGKEVYITSINTKSWATHPYHISTGNKLGKGDLGWLKLNQLSGYATGKKNFSNNEWAWTQEGGKEEYIIRPSDGAILTPVARKGSVLNAEASNNLWNMTNSPAEFIKNNLGLDASNVPNGTNLQNNLTQHFENINFNMPNVHSYNELLTEMQKDKNFENLILAITVNQIAGKSKLAKGKAIR